mgnify:CR=1 FL=1|tara:strand:- start:6701 stop:7978 length:1278 start_codon:yes stop_codon:yes gene_type:complete
MALAKKRKAIKRAPSKRGAKLESPKWDGWEKLSGEDFHRKKEGARSFYYENYQAKDLYAFVFSWMAKNGYTNEDIKLAKLPPDHMLSVTCAICCKLLLDGMPDFYQKEDDYWQTLAGTGGNITPVSDFIKKRIAETIEAGKVLKEKKLEVEKEEAKKKNVYRPSIQELLRAKAFSMTNEIDDFINDFEMTSGALKSFKPLSLLRKVEAKANHAKIIKELYEGCFKEYDELVNPPSTKNMTEKELDWHNQLIEGYRHLEKSEILAMHEMYKSIVQACDMIIANAKFDRKPRKRKPVSAEKVVSKMKFMREHTETGTVSINPVDIVGSNVLVVYNTKSRKVGVYHTSNVDPMNQKREGSGLTVKGTTMLRFNEETSVQKTLRKPQEQLKIFKDINKRSLNKQFEAVKSVPTKMNGRINEHTLLLKVF